MGGELNKWSMVYPSTEPKKKRAMARLFTKEVKTLNDSVVVDLLEFPELTHQEPVRILKGQ